MGRKSREKRERRKQKAEPAAKRPQYFHVSTAHPGAATAMRTPPEEIQDAMRTEMLANMPGMREEINAGIVRLLDILRTNDPIRLLFTVALQNSIFDPERYVAGDSENAGSPVKSEYALSLAASLPPNPEASEPSEATIDEFGELLDQVLTTANMYFVTETMDPKYAPAESEARMQMITETLNVRGDSRRSHAHDLVRHLFVPHDQFLSEHFGFATEDFIRAALLVEKQISRVLNDYLAFTKRLRETIDESARTLHRPSAEAAALLSGELADLAQNPFEINPTQEMPAALLDLLSLKFGENAPFAEFEKAPGWPTNDSRIFARPILAAHGRYYAFAPHILIQNLVFVMEELIRRADKKYFTNSYAKKRGKVLEQLAVKYLTDLLPGAKAYEKVYYPSKECEDSVVCECDALVLVGRTLFIVEAKAAAVAASTRRGGLKSIEADVKELIANAQTQGARAKRYIEENAPARFTFEDGSEAITFTSRAELGDIFIINVTLSHLGALATKLTTSAAMGLLKERVWPWTVFVNDLRSVSEVFDSSAEFIAFLKQRLSLHDTGIVTTSDENDILGAFLAHGLDFTDAAQSGAGMVLIDPSYSRPLDRYFLGQEGVLAPSAKPRLDVPTEIERLARGLEASGPLGIEAAAEILALPRPVLQFIDEKLRKMLRAAGRGEFHDITVPPQRKHPGVTIAVGSVASPTDWRKRIETYSVLKKYRERAARWLVITIGIAKDGLRVYASDLLEDEWRPDPVKERASDQLFTDIARMRS
ncbi:MAG TPA: hypothetical protein VEK11_25660 [Thermoanaerobaculia bacterium]|nr:hypothetical protein [Thermoanaerobaculia bacterium]